MYFEFDIDSVFTDNLVFNKKIEKIKLRLISFTPKKIQLGRLSYHTCDDQVIDVDQVQSAGNDKRSLVDVSPAIGEGLVRELVQEALVVGLLAKADVADVGQLEELAILSFRLPVQKEAELVHSKHDVLFHVSIFL